MFKTIIGSVIDFALALVERITPADKRWKEQAKKDIAETERVRNESAKEYLKLVEKIKKGQIQ